MANTLIITLHEVESEHAKPGSIQYQAADQARLRIALDASTPTRHEVSSGILQAMKEGRGPSHAAQLLEQLDRDMLRALGFDSIALVVQI